MNNNVLFPEYDCRIHYERLKKILSGYGAVSIAFSGGGDSALLLAAAKEALQDQVIALTAASVFFPESELDDAEQFCRKIGVRQIVFEFAQLDVPGFAENPKERCYLCKKALFSQLIHLSEEAGFAVIADGTNKDDESDFRPGMRALAELSVRSPLREAGLGKKEIRAISQMLKLPTAEKPSLACLASRIPTGCVITEEKIRKIDKAEAYLRSLGFEQVRVRSDGEHALIQVEKEKTRELLADETMREVSKIISGFGFTHVSADPSGYRSGSLNGITSLRGSEQ